MLALVWKELQINLAFRIQMLGNYFKLSEMNYFRFYNFRLTILLRQIVDELAAEGHIYSTIDEEHFRHCF